MIGQPADSRSFDVVVVGCGVAGLSAALAASDVDKRVAVLEKAPKGERGGHTRFSESFRAPSAEADLENYGYSFDVADYTREDFYEDIMHQTDGRADPDLTRTLVENAADTLEWLTAFGVDWQMEPLAVGYTAGRTWMDGERFVDTLVEQASERGVEFFYTAEARELQVNSARRVTGVDAVVADRIVRFNADTVIIAAGGYESNEEKRVKYYGSDYDAMKVRGSRYNTGEALDMAIDIGANPVGQWGGAHVAIIDAASPPVEGGANRVDGYQYGVIINEDGQRFVDEGQDARAHTYAKFGREIFEQPGRRAHIVVDDAVHEHVRATGPSDPVVAGSLVELFEALELSNPGEAVNVVEEYNAAGDPGIFDPDTLDGNVAAGIAPPKSNWALPIDEPPFYGYTVTGGITFGFGGLEITPRAEVLDTRGLPIDGLYAAGNSTGGQFFENYPGGTGLMNAAVFGRIAGEEACGD